MISERRQRDREQYDKLVSQIASLTVHQVELFHMQVPDSINVNHKGQQLLHDVYKRIKEALDVVEAKRKTDRNGIDTIPRTTAYRP